MDLHSNIMKAVYLALMIGLTSTIMVKAQKSRIWTIWTGFKYRNLQYLNKDGALVGVGIDLIDVVCMEAGMDCRVVRAPASLCWQSNNGENQSGGIALMRRSFDACHAFAHTRERAQVFKFSIPMYKAPDGYLYVVKGQNIDVNNLQGKQIGIIKAASTNVRCLAENSKSLVINPDFIKYYKHTYVTEAFNDMKRGELDVVFGFDGLWTVAELEQLRKVSPPYPCYIGGLSMMSRKDSAFTANWNVGFTKLKNTNKFEKFCEEANARHVGLSGKMTCLS